MTADWQETAFETRAIHAGQEPDPTTGAITTPIYQTSTFVQKGIDDLGTYEYGRTHNPTRTALQDVVASLEGAAWGLAYASGLAGTQNISYLLAPGDHIILTDDAYGGTHRFVAKVISRYGIDYTLVDMSDLEQIRAAIRPETRLIWAETPTNPYLKIVDIRGVADLIRNHPALLVVDNTFASPYLQNPLALGADLVLHSSTKYLGGHADVVGGVVVGNDPEIYETLKFHQNAGGAVPGPFDCWLVLRGIKTLPVRMERHSRNGLAVAEFLREHPAVRQVFYPGLARPSRSRRRGPADARFLRHGLLHRPRRFPDRGGGCAQHADLPARRQPRRGGVADRAPGADDARQRRGHRGRGRGHPAAPLRRHRERGRSRSAI